MLLFVFAGAGLAGCEGVDLGDTSGLDSRVGSSLIDAAKSSEARRDYATAAGYYRSVYERDPDNVEVVIGLSRNLRYLDRPDEAEAVVDRALRKAADDPALLAERGKVHLANQQPGQAVAMLGRAAPARPGDWDVRLALAVSYDRLGLYDQAEEHYQAALALAPDNPIVLNNHGLSLAQRGRLPQAIETLRRAASQPDATAQTRQNLALMYAVSGDLLRAEELVRRDLPEQMADENMAYYRRLAANRRLTDAGDAVRLAADQQGPAGPPVTAAPLPPASVETAVAEGETPQAAAAPAAADDRPGAATPAADQPRPGQPTPLAPAEKPSRPAAAGGGTAAPSAAPSAASPSGAAAASASRYQLQLASFRRQEQAELARQQLLAAHKDILAGIELRVSRISLGSRGDYFRVLSEPVGTRDAAADLCRVLKTRRADCLLVRAEAAE